MNDVLLLRDAIDNLVDYLHGAPQTIEQRLIKRVIREAYREFVSVYRWSYFDREASLLLPSSPVNKHVLYNHVDDGLYLDNTVSTGWEVLTATDTTPVVMTIANGFSPVDGESVKVHNINTVEFPTYTLTDLGGGNWELTGSATMGPYLVRGIIYRPGNTFTAADVGKRIRIGNNSYPIVKYTDSWNVQLSSSSNPGETLVTADAILEGESVLLPEDFVKMAWVADSQSLSWSNAYVPPEQWLAVEQTYHNQSTHPFRWTVLPSASLPNRWEIRWAGTAGDDRHISFIYRRRPNDELRWSGIETGASSIHGDIKIEVDGTTGVTGTNTLFTSAMVGSWLRIGRTKTTTKQEPTGLDGSDPYIEQHRIASVASATSLTLETPASYSATDQSFVVSDQLDLAHEHYNPFYALCQRLHAYKVSDEDRIGICEQRYRDALILAMETDYKVLMTRSTLEQSVYPSPFENPRNADFGTYVNTPFG